MALPRAIYIDDNDPVVNYTGGTWTLDPGSHDRIGNFGPSHLNTLHVSNGQESMVTIPFKGTSVTATGFVDATVDDTSSDPSWQCVIDGINHESNRASKYPLNNWILCENKQLNDADHVLQIKAKGTRPFYFDAVMYTPGNPTQLSNGMVQIPYSDPVIKYDNKWVDFTAGLKLTNVKDSSVDIPFVGNTFSWFSWSPDSSPAVPSTAKYSLDGAEPRTFQIQGRSSASDPTQYNVPLFSLTGLTQGPHQLKVTFTGEVDQAPLTLAYLKVLNTTAATSHNNPTQSPPANRPPPSEESSSRFPTGAVIGGIVGGLAIIGLVSFYFFWRRRKRILDLTKYGKEEFDPRVEPFSAGTQPYTDLPGHSRANSLQSGLLLYQQDGETPNSRPMCTPGGLYPPTSFEGSSYGTPSEEGSSTTPHVPLGAPLSGKRREAAAAAAAAAAAHSDEDQQEAHIVVHNDSGLRLTPDHRPVVELPPTYSQA